MSVNRPESMPSRIAGKLGQLPSLPQAAERLTREVLKDEPDLGEVTRIIESDPALVSRVLRLVNSPYYGVRWKISSVEHAVGLLGFRAMESIVLSLTVYDCLTPKGPHSVDFTRHWQHSLSVAAAAKYIAEKCSYPVPAEAYTAGILHDVGRAALDISMPEEFARVAGALELREGVGVEIERDVLGIDHAMAGRFLLTHWNMDEKLAEAVGLHHDKTLRSVGDRSPAGLAGILQAADLAAWSAGLGSMNMPPKLSDAPAVHKFLAETDLNALAGEMEEEIRRAAELFGVEVPDGGDIRLALGQATAEVSRLRSLQQEVERRLEHKSRTLDIIRHLVADRAKGGTRRDVLLRTLPVVCEALGSERAAFFERDAGTGAITGALVEDVTGISGNITEIHQDAPEPESPLARAIATGEPVLLAAQAGADGLLGALGSAQAVCAPVNVSGAVAGFLIADNPISGRPLGEADLEMAFVLAAETGIALENAVLQQYSQELKAMAETDTLTDLSNRRNLLRHLESEIQRARRYGKPISLVMIDIDHFKGFNDTYGHQAGDRILKMLGNLLKNSCRNIDTPGRLGGEEFLVVLPETDIEAAVVYAERVRVLVEKLGERIKKRYPLHTLTISVGLTSYNAEADDLDSLVRRADNAMYSAKKRGRNRICAL